VPPDINAPAAAAPPAAVPAAARLAAAAGAAAAAAFLLLRLLLLLLLLWPLLLLPCLLPWWELEAAASKVPALRGRRSITSTVTLSRVPRSRAALVRAFAERLTAATPTCPDACAACTAQHSTERSARCTTVGCDVHT
jgi:hypothetical protein